jgi:hypothetical protein
MEEIIYTDLELELNLSDSQLLAQEIPSADALDYTLSI